jgi:hypothetical protein
MAEISGAEMKPRKPKASEPSLRDKLSQNFLSAFESDFKQNGVAAIESLRQKSPEKYAEIAARLIAATEPKPEGFKALGTGRKSPSRYSSRLVWRKIKSRLMGLKLRLPRMRCLSPASK